MPRTHQRHLTAALGMTTGVGLLCAPIAWLQLGTPGLYLVAGCAAAILAVAALSDLLTWLLGSAASPALAMVIGAACRMLLVIAMMIFALKASPTELTGFDKPYVAIYLIPFYFGLLAVEVFSAKTILTASQQAQEIETSPAHHTPA